MKIKINIELVLIYLITLCIISFFGIININKDVSLLLSILLVIYVEIKYIKVKINCKNKFNWMVVIFAILILVSSIRSYQLYDQPLILGIRAQRQFFIMLCMYFPINKLIRINKISKNQIIKMIYIIGTIQLILYILFFMTKGNMPFLNYNYDYRYGGIRLRVECCITDVLFILSLNNYINGKDRKKNLILMLLSIIVCTIILKTRLLMLSYFMIILLAIFLWKRGLRKKIFIVLSILLLIPTIFNSTIVKDTIDTILENDKNDIRTIGKKFYMKELKKSPLVGRGYVNLQWMSAVKAIKMNENILLVDNGIYAFVFMYGILGGIWFLSIILKLIKMSLEIYRKRENYYGLLYFMYITVLLPNIIWWYFSDAGTLMFVIILCLVENEVEKEDENRSSISYF